MKFEGKVALVTGASSGIGRAVALNLAEEGASVIVNYSGNESGALDVVREIKDNGGSAEAFRCDVSDSNQVDSMVKYVIEKYGRIDILVNNAGITRDALILRMELEDFERVIDINLKGTFNTIKSVSKYMIKQKSGKIINIASIIGLTGNVGQANYAASKAGVIALTKSAAKEFASRNINVNAIAPGYIETRMTEVLSDRIKDEIISKIPLKRQGMPEDVAKAVIFLASEDSKYITGQVINVDGGMVM
ncbi:3-oxoacyl-[acyl-carrier-protein] reductase [Fonticella tunisiensis]|uniref:3-oxoacyl-[acyl-carrier-protein] reductase n=1 Tax=Fonticella tunisiensis TaxID=1096341 RepID=A0A4R7KQW1_9CLOT|nr:3-oxoacyl-[acyl-carrier-protein] reductase [Fonticella tunisiensis]TDT61610.1 3-oxoacyl-[acyl-carrier-protein] reductase [Fonticella tunisiensis]